MTKKLEREDFNFSSKKLFNDAIVARQGNKTVTRMYLNGQEFTDRVPSKTQLSPKDDGIIIAANIIGASEKNPEFLITYREDGCEFILFDLMRGDGFDSATILVNPYLTIQVLRNGSYGDETGLCIQGGFALVKIIDRSLDNKETIFMVSVNGYIPAVSSTTGDLTKLEVVLYPKERWDKCYQQKGSLTLYEGEKLFLDMIYGCQKVYARVLKEQARRK